MENEITLEEAKEYLRIYFDDDDNFISELIEISRIYIDSCVGEAYKNNPKKKKLSDLLSKKYINDMYCNRSTEISEATKKDYVSLTILESLSLCGDEYE